MKLVVGKMKYIRRDEVLAVLELAKNSTILNELSEEYSKQTEQQITPELAVNMMKNAIEKGAIGKNNAFVSDQTAAANAMWEATGLGGNWIYEHHDGEVIQKVEHPIYQVNGHFVNSYNFFPWHNVNNHIFDVFDDKIKPIKNESFDNRKIKSTRLFELDET